MNSLIAAVLSAFGVGIISENVKALHYVDPTEVSRANPAFVGFASSVTRWQLGKDSNSAQLLQKRLSD